MDPVDDEKWMRECLRLAQKGVGSVSPNPLVGAVIVRNGKMLGKGFHRKYGEAHAEINAIANALSRRSNIRGATLYVNLEPCTHFGKTPPCVEALRRHGISTVVAAMKDPNPLVAGKGFKFLRNAEIKVVTGILKNEAEQLNEKFIKYIVRGIPFVGMKVAQTYDGFIAREDGSSKWITTKASRSLGHRLRSEYDAVLVGAGTAIKDDPRLTVRHVHGINPLRVLVDGNMRTSVKANLLSDRFRRRTIMFVRKGDVVKIRMLKRKGVQVILMKGRQEHIPMKEILNVLAKKGVASLLVEGGQSMYRQFLKRQLADRLHLFVSPKRFGRGISTFGDTPPSFRITQRTERRIGRDRYIECAIAYRKGK